MRSEELDPCTPRVLPAGRLREDDESIRVSRWLTPEIEREFEQERRYRQQQERGHEDARTIGFDMADAVAEAKASVRRVVVALVEGRRLE